jgi:hypothetical protein
MDFSGEGPQSRLSLVNPLGLSCAIMARVDRLLTLAGERRPDGLGA